MKILCLVFLMGLVPATVRSEECPPKEDVDPCTCTEEQSINSLPSSIMVRCDKKLEKVQHLKLLMNALRGKSNVKLNFIRQNLGSIPSNFFYGIGVTSLRIHDCNIDSLTDKHDRRPFSGLEDTLEELKISFSFSGKSVPVNMKFDHMKKLKKMHISYNEIRKMNREWFQDGPESLEELIISNNHIDEFQDNTFERLINLKKLIFEGNLCGVSSEVLKWNMLPKAHKLTYVGFDSNCIEGLRGDAFRHMLAVKTISLRYNKIKKMEENPWKDILNTAEEIYLEGNPLECDSHMNWIMPLKTTDKIYGKCKNTSKSLRDFIKDKGY